MTVGCQFCRRVHDDVTEGSVTERRMYRVVNTMLPGASKAFYCSPVCHLREVVSSGGRTTVPGWGSVRDTFYERNNHVFGAVDIARHKKEYVGLKGIRCPPRKDGAGVETVGLQEEK